MTEPPLPRRRLAIVEHAVPVYVYVDLDAGQVHSVSQNDDAIELVKDAPVTDADGKPLEDPEAVRHTIEIAETEDWP